MAQARERWNEDRKLGCGGLYMPDALDRKFQRAFK
jgi:hypothetical protein